MMPICTINKKYGKMYENKCHYFVTVIEKARLLILSNSIMFFHVSKINLPQLIQ